MQLIAFYDELINGRVRPIGSPASGRRDADMVMGGAIEVLRSNTSKSNEKKD